MATTVTFLVLQFLFWRILWLQLCPFHCLKQGEKVCTLHQQSIWVWWDLKSPNTVTILLRILPSSENKSAEHVTNHAIIKHLNKQEGQSLFILKKKIQNLKGGYWLEILTWDPLTLEVINCNPSSRSSLKNYYY